MVKNHRENILIRTIVLITRGSLHITFHLWNLQYTGFLLRKNKPQMKFNLTYFALPAACPPSHATLPPRLLLMTTSCPLRSCPGCFAAPWVPGPVGQGAWVRSSSVVGEEGTWPRPKTDLMLHQTSASNLHSVSTMQQKQTHNLKNSAIGNYGTLAQKTGTFKENILDLK